MKKMLKKGTLITLSACLLLAGCGKKQEAKTLVKIVKTTTIESSSGTLDRTFPGTVKSESIADLSFDAPGKIINLPIKEGQKVKKGQLIAQIKPEGQNYRLDSGKANYFEAQADYERDKGLYAEGVISAAEYQGTKKKYEMAKSSLNLAQKGLNDTYLNAPFAGTITQKNVESQKFVGAGNIVAVLQDLDNLEIEVNFPESLISKKDETKDATYLANFSIYPNIEIPLELKSIGKQADSATKTYPVKFKINNDKNLKLYPGMSVFVNIHGTYKGKSTPNVPVNAIFKDGEGQECIWVVDKNNKIKKQTIDIIEIKGKKAYISSDANNKTRIVISGVYKLLEGDEIKEYERLDLNK